MGYHGTPIPCTHHAPAARCCLLRILSLQSYTQLRRPIWIQNLNNPSGMLTAASSNRDGSKLYWRYFQTFSLPPLCFQLSSLACAQSIPRLISLLRFSPLGKYFCNQHSRSGIQCYRSFLTPFCTPQCQIVVVYHVGAERNRRFCFHTSCKSRATGHKIMKKQFWGKAST